MRKSARASSAIWLGLALAVGLSAAPARLAAQTVVDELTVTGRYGVGPSVRSLSTAVSYRDLDLATQDGRDALRQRVRAAAYDLCRRLGEAGNGGTALVPSCERDAMNSAAAQERLAAAGGDPRAYAVAPPAAPAADAYGRTASFTSEPAASPPGN